MFKPYSPKIRGDLESYLREHDGFCADNLFYGPKYYFIIKNKGFMVPERTLVRVNRSPIPDLGYIVNNDFLLESPGQGDLNMSLVGAKKGIYNPSKVLRGMLWTIKGLNLRASPLISNSPDD